jgi:hypothetical protein
MRKLLPSTIRSREETKRRMEEFRRDLADASARLDSLRCHTPQDPYSYELDYKLIGGGAT